jgi:hypothetical protein
MSRPRVSLPMRSNVEKVMVTAAMANQIHGKRSRCAKSRVAGCLLAGQEASGTLIVDAARDCLVVQ